jgi:hypothetical protein
LVFAAINAQDVKDEIRRRKKNYFLPCAKSVSSRLRDVVEQIQH